MPIRYLGMRTGEHYRTDLRVALGRVDVGLQRSGDLAAHRVASLWPIQRHQRRVVGATFEQHDVAVRKALGRGGLLSVALSQAMDCGRSTTLDTSRARERSKPVMAWSSPSSSDTKGRTASGLSYSRRAITSHALRCEA